MVEEKTKALAVLQTALIVSTLSAVSIGMYYSFRHDQTFTEFISISYLTFINKLAMPVGLATFAYYFIIIRHKGRRNILSTFKKFLILSIILLIFIFFWNALETLFRFDELLNTDRVTNNLTEEFFGGLLLCGPVSVLVMVIYFLIVPKNL